ncbi:MAG TPA: preprotein translocase subunit SecA [Myxococcota bacterium]|nr:preprotein translocase subunit SecA [Myxococcota bacterium]
MFTGLAKRIFGDANEREVRRLQPLVQRVNDLEPRMRELDDARLAAQTAEFRQRIANGATVDDLLVEAFATVREVGRRTMGMRHYDSQLVGGIVIHRGQIAEMKTGEGKTLVATLPVYLNALEGKGVHLVTVNDYLAARDAEWMGRIYKFLGMSVGTILSNDRGAGSQERKRAAYASDITYGTNNEFGFDYLRDNMKFSVRDYVQRGHHFGIVDEVDSILIDEARTPLIISGPAQGSVDLYNVVDAVIPLLQKDVHFTLDAKSKNVTLTEEGIAKVEDRLGIDNLYDPQNLEVLHHAMQSLKAHHLFKRDVDYMVKDGEIKIIDEFTGRVLEGRRWSDGLHQAVEAKEKVRVQEENQTYATITYQNLYRMYTKLAGMTGTAVTEAAEFMSIYKLPVTVIPTHRPVVRKDMDDVVYLNQTGKYNAVLDEIRKAHERGQPVLVGTTSVANSDLVSNLLRRAGIPHEKLNAKEHEREAHIVAQAGRFGAVTISTNMAGRGTDIRLGGNAEELARLEIEAAGGSPELAPEAYQAAVARFTQQVAEESERGKAAGGLYIIGTERHESRRVDNQLRGRSGRQGDPGASKFFLALDDQLMKIFGSDRMTNVMQRMGLKEDEAIEHRWITASIENAQKKVEAYNFSIRKNLLEYDDVMNYQRKGVYELRRRALEGDAIGDMIDEAVRAVVDDILDDYCGEGLNPESWNVNGIRENIRRCFGAEWSETDAHLRDMARRDIQERMLREARERLATRRDSLGTPDTRGVVVLRFADSQSAQQLVYDPGKPLLHQVARQLLLQITDELWRDHLLAIDRLRQGIGLRGYGQRNPVLEYKKEAFSMFLRMSAARDDRFLSQLEAVQILVPQVQAAPRVAPEPLFDAVEGDGPEATEPPLALPEPPPPAAPTRPPEKGEEARAFALQYGVKRNDPCPCGSGQKFKKCCGGEAAAS